MTATKARPARPAPAPPPELDLVSYAELLPDWEQSCRASGKGDGTMKAYRQGTRGFLAWALKNGETALSKGSAERWMIHMLHVEARKKNTICSRLVGLRSFSAWLLSEGETPVDICFYVKQPKLDQTVVNDVGDDDLKKVLKMCKGIRFIDYRDEAAIRVFVETGMRAAELLALTVDDVDMARGLIKVMGKGRKERIVVIGPQTAEALGRYIRKRRAHRLATSRSELWLGEPTGGPGTITYSGLWKALKKRGRDAGVEDFRPHRLRHSFGVRWKRAGGSDSGLMTAAGWKSASMIAVYTGSRATELSNAEARELNLGDL